MWIVYMFQIASDFIAVKQEKEMTAYSTML